MPTLSMPQSFFAKVSTCREFFCHFHLCAHAGTIWLENDGFNQEGMMIRDVYKKEGCAKSTEHAHYCTPIIKGAFLYSLASRRRRKEKSKKLE